MYSLHYRHRLPNQNFLEDLPVNNPLLTSGIISVETSKVLFLPQQEIPKGRKRPLSIQLKARVMPDESVEQDLDKQREEIQRKEYAKRYNSATSKGKGKGKGRRSLWTLIQMILKRLRITTALGVVENGRVREQFSSQNGWGVKY